MEIFSALAEKILNTSSLFTLNYNLKSCIFT